MPWNDNAESDSAVMPEIAGGLNSEAELLRKVERKSVLETDTTVKLNVVDGPSSVLVPNCGVV